MDVMMNMFISRHRRRRTLRALADNRLWRQGVNMMATPSMIQEYDDLGLSVSLNEFINTTNKDKNRPSGKSFMEVVRACAKAGKWNLFQNFVNSSIRGKYLSSAVIVQQVIDELMSNDHVDWLKHVCQCSEQSLCMNEKLIAFWTSKRFDLLECCIPLTWCRRELLPLNLETVRVILRDAVQEEASDDMLKSVLVIAEVTDFLTWWLQLEDKLSDPAAKNLVDHIFLHLNVLELPQKQMKLLSMCSKRDVVFGKILLEAALQGNVCPLPESLQMLCTLDKTYFGVLDLEFLAPMFSENQFLHCVESSMARDTRDVVILLIRSGLLHQFGSWLKTKLEECRRKGCPHCKYCDPSTYLVHRSVPDGPAIQQLLLQSGFLPNKLLLQLPDVLPKTFQPSSSIIVRGPPILQQVGTEENDDAENNDNISLLRPQIQRRPPPTPSPSSQNIESVVKAFIQQPYSLLTMTAAQVSTMIGCHCGRTERIRKLPVPKLVQDHVAFRAGDFKLACEKEEEKYQKVMEDVYDGGDDDVDIDHLYSEEEDEDDDAEGGGYLRLSVRGEAAAEMEIEMELGEEEEEMNTC